MKKLIFITLVLSQIASARITELIYIPQNIDLNNDTVKISSPSHPYLHPGDGKARLFIHNFIKANEGERLLQYSPWWSSVKFTGLKGTKEWGFADRNEDVGYGVTAIQVAQHRVGMMLNTFDYNDGNGKSHRFDYSAVQGTAIQYNVDWSGAGRSIWNKSPDDLCVITKSDIHTSYTEKNVVNQAMITLKFQSSLGPSFFYNIMMYDSRSNPKINQIIADRSADTGSPIVITGSGIDSNYGHLNTSDILSRGTLPGSSKKYGMCINSSEINAAIRDIKKLNNHFKNLYAHVNASNLRLKGVIIGPEIARTKGPKDNGYIGMNVDELWVYREN